MHARHDSREISRPGREAFLARFEREVDPDGRLPEAEHRRRVELAKRAHFTRMATRSAEVRRARARGGRRGEALVGFAGAAGGGGGAVALDHLTGAPAGQAHGVAFGRRSATTRGGP